ncbi:phosphatase PAP2 family protein [Kitasatospora sp. NPDC127116]|uniref:phosphatase PAP2 family protein n=1 Tax=unclassified Kitasatospora TaxID=2633591 RepID=UPI00364128CC
MTKTLPPAPHDARAGQPRPVPPPRPRVTGWSRLRWLAWPLYLTCLLWFLRTEGIPAANDVLFLWLIAALLTAAVHSGHGPRGFLLVLRDWVPVMAVVWAYSLLRGYGAHTPWAPHWLPQLRFDEVLGFGETWTVRLQHALYTAGSPHWYDYAAVTVYLSHFFVVFLLLAVLWRRAHHRFRQLLAAYLTLTFAGFATYLLYPADPPWLVSQEGNLPHLSRVVWEVISVSGLPQADSLLENGSQFANDVAAMPSLHSAYPAMLLFFFWPTAKRWLRAVLVAYPLAMTFTLVYGAEHFIIDVFVGWAYAAVVVFGLRRLRNRRAAAATSGPAPAPGPAQDTAERAAGLTAEDAAEEIARDAAERAAKEAKDTAKDAAKGTADLAG